jgi:glycosyltransferase involved in cell wall biosynthesis
MKKTAVVYDKWLSTLGGGEVVACNFAKALIDNGYKTTFACGKNVDVDTIKSKLGIDLSKAEFVEIWNDEVKLDKLTKDKSIFINASFMDYACGSAKKNFYYTSFPTEPFSSLKGLISSRFLYPFISRYIKPIEFITEPKLVKSENGHLMYLIGKKLSIAFSLLKPNKIYSLKFYIFIPTFSKTELESFEWNTKDAEILDKKITINHFCNVVEFNIKIKALYPTIYFETKTKNFESSETYLIDPNISYLSLINKVIKPFSQKLNSHLRAGLFINPRLRMKKYDTVFANSEYTKFWIKKYWHKEAQVLYPPVDLIFKKNKINFENKKNYICSVGRFFTKGHGKKQEIMIEAFKQLCNQGLKNWELHLAGGIGSEPSSIEYIEKIKEISAGYPIIFHFNVNRQEIIDLYCQSKIYWHAAGFGENKKKNPIKFEHFGITPIEAISAGCIPILYDGGGLPETTKIIGLDTEQHLFNSIDKLNINTKKIIDQKITLDFKNIFKIIDNKFSQQAFVKNFKELI